MLEKIDYELNFNLIGNNKILLIGDTIVDKYIGTQFSKNSEESKSKVVRLVKQNIYLGGAANVALNLYLAGANFNFITMLGNCYYSKIAKNKLLEFLEKKQILIFNNKSNQTLKKRVLLNNKQILRIDDDTKKNKFIDNNIIKKKLSQTIPNYN